MPAKRLSFEEALIKAQRFCAYQDRCHQELRFKLIEWGVYGDDLENVLAELIQERFLDEERFARSFARGKFRIKQWGRLRIVQELKKRDVSEYCIRAGMSEIGEEDYLETLRGLLEKKAGMLGEDLPPAERFQKIVRHAISRGFEPGLARDVAKELEKG